MGTFMIKNIILDLGGIVINIDYDITSQAFKKLGAKNFDAVYGQNSQTELFDLYETGKISTATFRKELKKILNINVSDAEFDAAWTAMILDFPEGVLDFIETELKPNYKTILFSNINETSLAIVNQKCLEQTGRASLDECFHKTYYSHLFGHKKPNQDAFELILQENDIDPAETLFVDDTIGHIKGARKAGLQTLHLHGDGSLFDIPGYLATFK